MSFYDLGALSILVVDDDPNITVLMSDLLTALGVGKVAAAPNGEVARRMLAERSLGSIDIVLTDYSMSPGNGAELLRWIRRGSDTPNRFVPVILMSAHGDMDTLRRMRELGITDVLAKPVSLDSLCQLLTRLFQATPRFVETRHYFGPDRRRLEIPYRGGERRLDSEELA